MLGSEISSDRIDRGPFTTIDKFNRYLSVKTDFSKKYRFYERAIQLKNYCDSGTSLKYINESSRKNALKSFIASLRFFGLKKTINDLRESLLKLEFDSEEKKNFSKNLVNQYCSQNLTVISKRQLSIFMEKSFLDGEKIDDKSVGNLFSDAVIREKNLARGIRSFRNFCSWSGDPDTFDLLEVYLHSPLFIQRAIDFFFYSGDTERKEIIGCENNICRRESDELGFEFPLSIASDSVEADFKDIYCEYFYEKKMTSKKSSPFVFSIKSKEGISELQRDLFYFLKITGILENAFNYVSSKEDLIYVLESPIDRYFNTWSESQLSSSENNLTFEEDFQFNLISSDAINENNILLNISGGEIDNTFSDISNLKMTADLRFAEKFLKWWLKTKFETLPSNVKKLNHLKKVLKMELEEMLPKVLEKVPLYESKKEKFHDIFFSYFYGHFTTLSKRELKPKDLLNYKLGINVGAFALQKIYRIKKYQTLTED